MKRDSVTGDATPSDDPVFERRSKRALPVVLLTGALLLITLVILAIYYGITEDEQATEPAPIDIVVYPQDNPALLASVVTNANTRKAACVESLDASTLSRGQDREYGQTLMSMGVTGDSKEFMEITVSNDAAEIVGGFIDGQTGFVVQSGDAPIGRLLFEGVNFHEVNDAIKTITLCIRPPTE